MRGVNHLQTLPMTLAKRSIQNIFSAMLIKEFLQYVLPNNSTKLTRSLKKLRLGEKIFLNTSLGKDSKHSKYLKIIHAGLQIGMRLT